MSHFCATRSNLFCAGALKCSDRHEPAQHEPNRLTDPHTPDRGGGGAEWRQLSLYGESDHNDSEDRLLSVSEFSL
jgi:hypothetical protein